MKLYLREDVAALWTDRNPLAEAFALQGEVFREVARRKTMKVNIAGGSYFVKLHEGVGWVEIIKNWLQFKRPVLGAENEFLACRGLAEVGIKAPVPVAFAMENLSMARRRSFILCEELTERVSLEDFTETWFEQPATPETRHRMLLAIAEFARAFHQHGFIHRDFYICHLLAQSGELRRGRFDLAVLDLHRARRFDVVPDRWLRRDLGALLFSTLDLGFSTTDWLRFIRRYSGRPLKTELAERGDFWISVRARAHKLYREGERKGIVKGLYHGADG